MRGTFVARLVAGDEGGGVYTVLTVNDQQHHAARVPSLGYRHVAAMPLLTTIAEVTQIHTKSTYNIFNLHLDPYLFSSF